MNILKFLILNIEKTNPIMRNILENNVVPSYYELELNVREDNFSGIVQISCKSKNEIDEFSINSKGLEIKRVIFEEKETGFIIDKENDILRIKLPRIVYGDFQIIIEYDGNYSKGMDGIYKSTYKDRLFFSTHFEPMDARKAFPCFDQPDMKARFLLSIIVPGDEYIALSNMNPVRVVNNRYDFEITPVMSTYIVAFVVGQLKYIEKIVKRNGEGKDIPVRVYGHDEEVMYGKFALDIAVRTLQFYESYFGVKYALDKLDMVAIPSFSMGAMENWGLITYRSSSLLYDPEMTSIRSKRNIAITVAHEIAHMWFGNLVTMKWWNELWLNEGFATWAATLSLQESCQDIMPMNFWMSFLNDETGLGMFNDALRSTHAIEAGDEKDINQIFDAISYSKASSIINMVEKWLGPNVFRKGISEYFKKYAFTNTVKENLWESLGQAVEVVNQDIEVNQIVTPWIVQKGFPWIDVSEDNGSLILKQERFTLGFFDKEETLWPIPLTVQWGNDEMGTIVMQDKEIRIEKLNDHYKFNINASGFYRVKYPPSALHKLFGLNNISVIDRLNILADAFEFGLANIDKFPFEFLKYFKDESNYETLRLIIGNLVNIREIFYDLSYQNDFLQKITFSFIETKIDKINFNSTENQFNSSNEASLASLIVNCATIFKHKPTVEKFASLVDTNGKLDVKLVNKEFIRSYFIANVDNHFDQIFQLATETSLIAQHAILSLGSVSDENKLNIIFDQIEKIPRQDIIYLFSGFSSNIPLRHSIMNVFIKNYNRIKNYVSDYNLLRQCIEYVFSNVLSPDYVTVATKFLYSLQSDKNLTSAIEKSLDTINYKIKIRDAYVNSTF